MSDFDGAAASAIQDELWYVQLAADDVRTMTLDQLDEAFQSGGISASTYVCQVGSTTWETLADVAGIEPEDAPPASAANVIQPAQQAAVLPSSAPAYPGTAGGYASSASRVQPQASSPYAAPISLASASYTPPSQFGVNSTAPVATEIGDMDVDFDVEPAQFRSKKGRVVLWTGALASVAAIAFGVVKMRTPAVVEFPPMPAGAALTPEPQVDLVAAVLAAAPPVVPAPAASAAGEERLGDDTKKALAEADKTLAGKQKAKKQRRQETRVAAPRKRSKADQPFTKGGSRYDPLNSSL